jgi:O-acetyl-ADP-ribose deacetylase
MQIKIQNGNIVEADTSVIVNAWNRNIIPWFLLLPQGVSGAIKKTAGFKPFNELLKVGPMKLGSAVSTSAGKLKYDAIIHVAGINMLWTSSEKSIRNSVRNAMGIINKNCYKSVAFPVIGAGSGGFDEDSALEIMIDELNTIDSDAQVVIVKFSKR